MIEDKSISIIGGDLRLINVARILKDNTKVYTYGLSKSEHIIYDKKIYKCKDVNEVLEKSQLILTSIPLSKDGINVNSPYSEDNILIENIFNSKNKDKIIISGKIPEKYKKNDNIIDLLDKEEFAIYNSIASAEGAIQSIISNTDFTIYSSNILILGFGRLGKVLADRLKSFGGKIYCAARKEKDFAWIETLGYKSIKYNELNFKINMFDIIINTVPIEILKEEQIKRLKQDCFILDISSTPGGVDIKSCEKYKIKHILYLGIPGKIAPVTSAKIIIKMIRNEILKINNEGV